MSGSMTWTRATFMFAGGEREAMSLGLSSDFAGAISFSGVAVPTGASWRWRNSMAFARHMRWWCGQSRIWNCSIGRTRISNSITDRNRSLDRLIVQLAVRPPGLVEPDLRLLDVVYQLPLARKVFRAQPRVAASDVEASPRTVSTRAKMTKM